LVVEDVIIPPSAPSFTSETKYGALSLLNPSEGAIVEPFELKTYSDGTKNYTYEKFTHTRINKTTYYMSSNPPLEKYIVNGITYYTVWSEVRPRPYFDSPHTELYYNAPNGIRNNVSYYSTPNNPEYSNVNGSIIYHSTFFTPAI
jgi:hypothetical protein